MAILQRINPRALFTTETRFFVAEERKDGLTVGHLFREGRALGTALIWTIIFVSLLDIYLIASWLPTLLHDAGLSLPISVVITAMTQLSAGVGWLMLAACAGGVVGGQVTANTYAAAFYPTYIRAPGVGWALGIGRVGAVVGPGVGGIMLALHWSKPSIFVASAVPALIAVLAVLALMHLERRKIAPLPRAEFV